MSFHHGILSGIKRQRCHLVTLCIVLTLLGCDSDSLQLQFNEFSKDKFLMLDNDLSSATNYNLNFVNKTADITSIGNVGLNY